MRSFINPGRGTRDVGCENLEFTGMKGMKGMKWMTTKDI